MAMTSKLIAHLGLWAGVTGMVIALGCSAEKGGSSTSGINFGQGGDMDSGEAPATGAGGAAASDTSSLQGTGGTEDDTQISYKSDACGSIRVSFIRRTPMVEFVVDRSQTMELAYGNSDPDAGPVIRRWDALHDAIMDKTNGVIAKTQSEIYTGIMFYDGGDLQETMQRMFPPGDLECSFQPDTLGCPDNPYKEICPRLVTVPPAKNNYDAIAAKYTDSEAGPGGTTPTAAALEAAYKELDARISGNLDKKVNLAPVVILVTDGQPNGCSLEFEQPQQGGQGGQQGGQQGRGMPQPKADYQGPIDQVTAAAKKNIKTYVIGIDTSVAGSDPEVSKHLDQLASIGSNNTVKQAFLPTNQADLADTLVNLIVKSNCEIQLDQEIVKGKEGEGKVTYNSQTLKYNDPDGYTVTKAKFITLQGQACAKFAKDENVKLEAEFPCDTLK
jgi:ferritin-like protein